MKPQSICLLGATGSIGASTLAVVRQSSSYNIYAVSGYHNVAGLFEIIQEFNPQYAVLVHEESADKLAAMCLSRNLSTTVLSGKAALADICIAQEVNIVVAGIVGTAGLVPTLAAVEAGKKVLLANKESMVMAGELLRAAAQVSGAHIIPIDSEHNAIFQCLPQELQNQKIIDQQQCTANFISSIILTASGGPFRDRNFQDLQDVTPDQACAHPNWSMGRKVSVDSATLMNKGLELIEACYLFGVKQEFIKAVVHPQSIVHSMVAYIDGTTIAHLSNTSMQVPIAHALAWPKRHTSGIQPIDWQEILQLDFLPLSSGQFPCFDLARQAMTAAENGSAAPAVLNVANEVGVAQFLNHSISFTDIFHLNSAALEAFASQSAYSLSDILTLELEVRQYCQQWLNRNTNTLPCRSFDKV